MRMDRQKITVVLDDNLDIRELLGPNDEILKVIEESFHGCRISVQSGILLVEAEKTDVEIIRDLLEELQNSAKRGVILGALSVRKALEMLQGQVYSEVIYTHGVQVGAKSAGQDNYLQSMDDASVVFGIGPAGTGKTYLAMAKAVEKLLAGEVKRIILTRPAVEAGENLGYLPGSLTEKIDPYLRPLYDALREMLDPDELLQLLESGTIEIAPLAYMRGRTLSDAFIVLDEAQNTTAAQMKMFLTRLGFNSKMVVTGDLSQIDLPRGQISGLREAEIVLEGVKGVEICYLNSADVVRNELVGDIIDAYDRHDAQLLRS